MRLAINGLAALGNDEDRKLLVEFSRNATNGNALRIDAAQAIAMYSEVPHLLEAAELLNGSTVDLIVAANLASPAPAESNQSQALQVLKQLCASSAYAAAGIAADALRQWNKVAVVELADVLATHQNPRARNAYVTALHDTVIWMMVTREFVFRFTNGSLNLRSRILCFLVFWRLPRGR